MNNIEKENIITSSLNNKLFNELVNLLKTNENIILNSIINDKFFSIIAIIKKIDYNVNNIKNLSDSDIILINDLIKDETNALTILLEIKQKKEEINNYINTINIIYNIILFIIILLYLYLIYDLYFINKDGSNIKNYLYYINILKNILLLTLIISLKNSFISIVNNIIAIKNVFSNAIGKMPLIIYIMIFKIILIFILDKYKLILNLANDYGYIIIIGIILIIVIISIYNIYSNYINQESQLTNIDLSVYILDKHGKQYLIDNNLYTEPIA